MKINDIKINTFTQAYLEAALFCEGLKDRNLWHFTEASLLEAKRTCEMFQAVNGDLLDSIGDDEQHGHDLWFTRNGHGVGYWDRDYGDAGETLTQRAEKLGESYVVTHEEDDDFMIELF